jgi:CubicO group peptidase (beta-lactamase class C family)
VVPDAEWDRVDPAVAGFDPAALDAIAADAAAAGSNCLAVVRHGRLVAEWTWSGTDPTTSQEVFSVTKAVASTLVGIAQGDGRLDVDDPAATWIPAWAGTPAAAVTVADLLGNDSGRHWDATTDYLGLLGATDRDAFAAGLAQDAAPGATWAYNNAAIQNLDAVVRGATGQETRRFADQRLFGPKGMAHTEMTVDGAGGTNMYFGVRSTCEDLARFGLLFLRDGAWAGRQVVPAAWVAAATGRPSQDLNAAYGYLWWLNREGPVLSDALRVTTAQQAAALAPSQLVPGAPDDMYWAIGLGGQIVQVDPGSDTVVVRLGPGRLGAGDGPGRTGDYGVGDAARVVTEALSDGRPGTLPG